MLWQGCGAFKVSWKDSKTPSSGKGHSPPLLLLLFSLQLFSQSLFSHHSFLLSPNLTSTSNPLIKPAWFSLFLCACYHTGMQESEMRSSQVCGSLTLYILQQPELWKSFYCSHCQNLASRAFLFFFQIISTIQMLKNKVFIHVGPVCFKSSCIDILQPVKWSQMKVQPGWVPKSNSAYTPCLHPVKFMGLFLVSIYSGFRSQMFNLGMTPHPR